MFYDRRLGCYVMYLFTHKGRVVFRLQSDSPYDWPNPSYDPAAALGWKGAANQGWKGFKDVVVDQNGQPIWAYAIHSLAGTPLAERGYVTTVLGWPRHVTLGGFSDDGLQFAVDAERPWLDPGSDTAGDILWNEQAGCSNSLCAPYTPTGGLPSLRQRISRSSRVRPQSCSRTVWTALAPNFTTCRRGPYEGMFIGLLHIFSTDRFEEVSDVSPRWPHLKYFGRIETELTYSYNGDLLVSHRARRALHADSTLRAAGRWLCLRHGNAANHRRQAVVLRAGHEGRPRRFSRNEGGRSGLLRPQQPTAVRDASGWVLFAQNLGPRWGNAHQSTHPQGWRDQPQRAHHGTFAYPRADAGRA